jgi:hypothetical protein
MAISHLDRAGGAIRIHKSPAARHHGRMSESTGRLPRRLPARAVMAPLALVAVVAVAVIAVERVREAAAREALVRLFYDYAVTDYCGTVTAAVHRGFEQERDAAMAALRLDHDSVRPLRLAGWERADREWENRGLGGFRGWCRTEGIAAADRFASAACAPGLVCE